MHPILPFVVPFLLALAWSPRLALPSLFVGFLIALLLAAVHRVALPGVAFVLGLLVANSVPPGPVLEGPVALQGRVVAAPQGRRADLAVWACAEGGAPFLPCRGRVRVRFPEVPAIGSSWVVRGRAYPPPRIGLGGPQPADSARRVGVRSEVHARVARPLGGPTEPPSVEVGSRGVLAAVARGDRRGVDPRVWEVLRGTGTAHLLAISGFHVGVVAATVGLLVGWVSRRSAVLAPAGFHPAWAWWIGALAGVVYAWSAGAPVSAQRAAGMVVLGAVGRSLSRRLDGWRFLVVVGVAVLAVDPSALVAPGFQLSFGAVVGLLRFGGPLQGALRPLGRVGDGLAASIAATLGTLPAAAWWFQTLAPTSPLANLVAVPWMAFAVAPLAATWAYGPEPLAGWAGQLGEGAVDLLLAVLARLVTEPLTPAVGATGALLLGAMFLRARPGWVGAVLLLVLGLRARPRDALEVTFFDVGQGDAALVEHPDGRRWLVDGGRSPRIVSALRRRGIRHLDRVIASHGDADHARGLEAVLCALSVDVLDVGRVEGHESLLDAAARCDVPVVAHGTVGETANAASLVTRVESPWGSLLLTGDLDAGSEHVLGPADVLKVPHHGSSTSSSGAMLDRVRPRLAVLSVGENRYGHPHAGVLERYAERGIPVVRTDELGTVLVRFDADGIHVSGRDGPLDLVLRRLPGEDVEHDHREEREPEADALAVGEQRPEHLGQEVAAAGVAPEHLHHRAAAGVAEQVDQHDGPVEGLSGVDDVDHRAECEQEAGLVELCGMQGHVEGSDRVGIRERDRPGPVERGAVAAPRREAPDASEPVGDGEGGGEDVPGREEGHPVALDEQAAGGHAEQDGAVEHEAARAEVDHLPERLGGRGVLEQEDDA